MPVVEPRLPWLMLKTNKMKEQFLSEVDLYDDLRNDPLSTTVMEDTASSYRPGDSMADTEVASASPRSNQRLIQNFRFFSVFGFTSTLMCTWELSLGTSYLPLVDGGVSGLVWTYIGSSIAMLIVLSCLAEMASMTPSSTGLYHWVGEFSPKSVQKYLSYLVGWSSILAWICGSAALNYMAGTMIQSIVALWVPSYNYESWHSTLIVIGVGVLCTILNTIFSKALPYLELISFFIHFLGIWVILIPLWVMAPKATAKDVFLTFEDGGNWGNIGLACLIGQIGPLFALLRTEGGTQIAGRIPNAARVIPYFLITTVAVSSLMGFLVILTFAFSIKDLQPILAAASHGYPFIEAYYVATSSKGFATAATVLIIFLIIGSSLSTQAIAARQAFAFARDEGLPFAGIWTTMVNIGARTVPVNAFCLSLAATIVVALIDLRLENTLQFVLGLFTSFSVTSCFIAIACVLAARLLTPENLPDRFWSLGVLSVPVHLLSLGYLTLMLVMSFFPMSLSDLSLATMNWASVVWAFIFAFCTLLYIVHARYVFKAPIWFV